MDQIITEQAFNQILEEYGGKIANKARVILLEDPMLKDLREPLEFISKSWCDRTPALVRLSCQAVGGNAENSETAALALTLMNLSFTIWDDVIDKARYKKFMPTVFGKFGQEIAIISGGIASAKAFSILNKTMQAEKRKKITDAIWRMWSRMASIESIVVEMRNKGVFRSRDKLWKMRSESINLGTCLRIGAVIGNGSDDEINRLTRYGRHLALILALEEDFKISINLSVELAEKIRNRTPPYATLWAVEHSAPLKTLFEKFEGNEDSLIKQFVQIFLSTKVNSVVSKKIEKNRKLAQLQLRTLRNTSAKDTLNLLVNKAATIFDDIVS